MSSVTLPDAVSQQLQALRGEIEFRDTTGRVIARGRTVVNLRELVADEDWPTDEELDRIAREDRGEHTPEQVMARLRGLTK